MLDVNGEEGKRGCFTKVPLGEVTADNRVLICVGFYLELQHRKGTCLIYSSFHHCAVWSGNRQEALQHSSFYRSCWLLMWHRSKAQHHNQANVLCPGRHPTQASSACPGWGKIAFKSILHIYISLKNGFKYQFKSRRKNWLYSLSYSKHRTWDPPAEGKSQSLGILSIWHEAS